MPDQPEAAAATAPVSRPTTPTAVPVVVVTPDDPILQAILAALNTALSAIHTWGSTSKSS
jgi:hypothetical protein